jgi:hypothetical protein
VQIERYLRAVCDQQMTCTIVGEVFADQDSIEFVEVCGYPDGARISVKTTLELDEGGRILRQLEVVHRRRSGEAHREVSAEDPKEQTRQRAQPDVKHEMKRTKRNRKGAER